MKLGFFTAALPGNTLEQAANGARKAAFRQLKSHVGRSKKPRAATRCDTY